MTAIEKLRYVIERRIDELQREQSIYHDNQRVIDELWDVIKNLIPQAKWEVKNDSD